MSDPDKPTGGESEADAPNPPTLDGKEPAGTQKKYDQPTNYISEAKNLLRKIWAWSGKITVWLDGHNGLLTAIATVVIAALTWVLAVYASDQGHILWAQLAENKIKDRPWIGLDVVQSDAAVVVNQRFHIMAFVKNFGGTPAVIVKTCFASDTPNVGQQDADGIRHMMEELSGCGEPTRTALMPNGEFGFDVSRSPIMNTPSVVHDVNAGIATFAVFGEIDYEDALGEWHRTRACVLRTPPANQYNACVVGNEIK